MTVAVKSVYDKLGGIEPAVSERMVRATAADLAEVIGQLKAEVKGPLTGSDVRILDGNHLAGTDHRLKELRRLGAAALPGQSIAVLNPQRQLIEDVVLEEDGHVGRKHRPPPHSQPRSGGGTSPCCVGTQNTSPHPRPQGETSRVESMSPLRGFREDRFTSPWACAHG
ncbi:MAG: hypothetical protein WD971_09980 [Pirellulales bacterium]